MNGKHYSKNSSGNYYIHKSIKGRTIHYGTFHTINEVKEAVCFLKNHNWDKRLFKEKYFKKSQKMKYIQQISNGHYMVQKNINGHLYSFGTFKKLEDAMHERDICVSCDWDYDLICEHEL